MKNKNARELSEDLVCFQSYLPLPELGGRLYNRGSKKQVEGGPFWEDVLALSLVLAALATSQIQAERPHPSPGQGSLGISA